MSACTKKIKRKTELAITIIPTGILVYKIFIERVFFESKLQIKAEDNKVTMRHSTQIKRVPELARFVMC